MGGAEIGQLIAAILISVGSAVAGAVAGWRLRKKADERREARSDYFNSRDELYDYAEQRGRERDKRAGDRE